jgi:hypothetical protein
VRPRELGVFDASSVVYDDDDIRSNGLLNCCNLYGSRSIFCDE